MDRQKLQELLRTAYEKQLEALDKDGGYDTRFENEMKRAIKQKIMKLAMVMK